MDDKDDNEEAEEDDKEEDEGNYQTIKCLTLWIKIQYDLVKFSIW